MIKIDSDDEDNSLRKIAKKTYKFSKKKSPKITDQTTVVQASESQELAWETAREMTKTDAQETWEPASSKVIDMLSSYTRLLNKEKAANLEDICKDNKGNSVIETLPEREDSSSSVENSNNCVENSTITTERELELNSDDSRVDVGPIAAQSVLLVPTSAEDISDFKTWCCSLCTFKNNDFLRVCEICETPRYKSRRKSTNKNCSTDEFVARKQRKIFEKCSGNSQRECGHKKGGKSSKRNTECSVAGSNDNRTEDSACLLVVTNGSGHSTDLSSVKPEVPVQSAEILVKPEVPVQSAEILVKPEMSVESVHSCELNTSDVDLFSPARVNEEVLDEIIMTSSCEEEIMTSPCMSDTEAENLFGTESEFDDITDDDWWVCTSCKNYNYDDVADRCQACGLKKPSGHFDDLVTGLEVDDDCWRCENCGEFNFGDDVTRKCTKCCHGDKKGRKSLVEQYRNLRHLIVDDEEPGGTIGTSDDKTQEPITRQETIENFMFRLSSYTDRVFLYDGVRFLLNGPVRIISY